MFCPLRTLHLLWYMSFISSHSCLSSRSHVKLAVYVFFFLPTLNDRKVVVCLSLLYQPLLRASWRSIHLFSTWHHQLVFFTCHRYFSHLSTSFETYIPACYSFDTPSSVTSFFSKSRQSLLEDIITPIKVFSNNTCYIFFYNWKHISSHEDHQCLYIIPKT